jgi:hypothetical protein
MRNGRSMRMAAVRRWGRKIVRAYHLRCAREDARKWQLIIPAGVWVCQHCPHVTFFDVARLRSHYAHVHAYA